MTSYAVREAATLLAIELRDCEWCTAKAGELCYAPSPGSSTGITRHWRYTHTARFTGLGEPEAFLTAHGRSIPGGVADRKVAGPPP